MISSLQFLKDWVLVLAVAVLVSIDIIILVIYTLVELTNGKFNAVLKSNQENEVSLHGVRKDSSSWPPNNQLEPKSRYAF